MDILGLIITVQIVLIILWNFILKGQMETQYGKQMCPLGPLTFCPYRDRPSPDFIFLKYFVKWDYSRFYISEPAETFGGGLKWAFEKQLNLEQYWNKYSVA